MFDFIVVLGSFIDIMMSEIDKADDGKKTQAAATAKQVHNAFSIHFWHN